MQGYLIFPHLTLMSRIMKTMVQEEDEDEDDDWREDRVIEVRWRDGLTGLSHVQVTFCQIHSSQ
jgi:hypothetical protein